MVVRELVALLGIKTDTASVKKAEAAAEGVTSKLAKIAIAAASAAVAIRSVFKFVGMASTANETLNVLNAAFEENTEVVKNWAKSFADEAGRSEFAMREMAADFGKVLNPLMGENAELATKMSMRLSQLTVDLASFNEMQEPEALAKMRAGLTGEAEGLKQLGIVMNDATLEVFRLAHGNKKSVKSMDIAEKTALRYNFILDKTKLAHGDAAKTATGWANATKNLGAKLKDLGTKLGFFFLPVAEKGIATLIGWMEGFADVVTPMAQFIATIMKIVFWVVRLVSNLPALAKVGLVAIAFLKWGTALKFLLTPFGKIMILIGLLILIIEDLVTWVEGGDSVFGKFFDTLAELTGVPINEWVKDIVKWFMLLAEDPVAAVEQIVAGLREFSHWVGVLFADLLETDVGGIVESWWGFFQGFFGGIIETVLAIIELLVGMFDDPEAAWIQFVNSITSIWTDAWDGIYNHLKLFADLLSPLWNSITETLQGVLNGLTQWVVGWVSKLLGKISSPFKTIGGWVSGIFGGGGVAQTGSIGPATATAPPGRGGMTNNQNTDVKIDIKASPGMDEGRLASEVSTQMRKVLEQRDRAAMKSFSTAGA